MSNEQDKKDVLEASLAVFPDKGYKVFKKLSNNSYANKVGERKVSRCTGWWDTLADLVTECESLGRCPDYNNFFDYYLELIWKQVFNANSPSMPANLDEASRILTLEANKRLQGDKVKGGYSELFGKVKKFKIEHPKESSEYFASLTAEKKGAFKEVDNEYRKRKFIPGWRLKVDGVKLYC